MQDNIALLPGASEDPKSIAYWRKGLINNETLSSIINSKAFLRLYDISFLGALDYTHEGGGKLKKKHRSRAEHSLNVAALASYVSSMRNYSDDLSRHLIVAGLLHDIGHAPLSHSAEPYIKKKIGYGHHEAGIQIIYGKIPLGHDLHKSLSQNFDLDFIIKLINGTASSEDGGDLFSSPINIDTIDGIVRSHTYFTGFRSTHCPLSIAEAAFGSRSLRRLDVLDSFWSMKHRVYSSLINDEIGIISDKASELFFQEHDSFEEGDMYCSERSWQMRHKPLFESFFSLLKTRLLPSWISQGNLSFTDRVYCLDRSRSDYGRFVCIKKKGTMKIGLPEKRSTLSQVEFNRF